MIEPCASSLKIEGNLDLGNVKLQMDTAVKTLPILFLPEKDTKVNDVTLISRKSCTHVFVTESNPFGYLTSERVPVGLRKPISTRSLFGSSPPPLLFFSP